MQLKLKVTKGKHAGQEVAIPGPKFLIGRAEDCHLRAGSDAISRHHCVIMIEDGYVGVRDFGSKNGTFINDERVVGERPLKANDVIRLGPLEFVAVILHEVGGKKLSKVKDVSEVAARISGGRPDSASDRDIDISDWLDDGQASPSSATSETLIGSGDTGEYSMDAAETKISRADTAAPSEPAKPLFQAEGAEKPKDSRSAAIEMLKKMQQLKRDQKEKKSH